jgi:hypothetical protein
MRDAHESGDTPESAGNASRQTRSVAAALAKMANTGRLAMPGVAAGLSNKAG